MHVETDEVGERQRADHVAAAQLHSVVDVLGRSRGPPASANTASLIIGQRMRFTTNPGLFLTTMGVLPSRFASASTAATVASSVCQPANQLDQRHHRDGIEEVHADELRRPRRRRGEPRDRDRRRVRARITPGGASASTCSRILDLTASFSVAASMIEVAGLQRVVVGRALDPLQRGILVRDRELFLLDAAARGCR